MANVIKVPHSINFIAEIDLDKIESNLIAPLLALSEEDLTLMCKEATLEVMRIAKVEKVANEGRSWATMSLAE
jgi:hypothetical protein